MLQAALLKTIVAALERTGLEYMLTGSLASSFHGEPRATHDIDVVVAIRAEDVDALFSCFPSESYYFERDAAQDSIPRGMPFNVIDIEGGAKVDFWPLTDEPFNRSGFSRRQRRKLLGGEAFVSSPEDTIVGKLRWAKLSGGSRRQLGDARGVYLAQRDQLDLRYIDEWVEKLGVQELWERVKREAEEEGEA